MMNGLILVFMIVSASHAWAGYGFMEQRNKAKVLQQYDATSVCVEEPSFEDYSQRVLRQETADCKVQGKDQIVACSAGFGTKIRYFYFSNENQCQEFRASRMRTDQAAKRSVQ